MVIISSRYSSRFLQCSLVIALILVSIISWGQTDYVKASDSDPEAISILTEISESYQAAAAHEISFNLDMEFPGQGMETQKGNLIQSGDKFVLEIQERKIISDGETVWMYLEEINEVQINDADFEEGSEFNSPSDIFNLHTSDEYVFAVSAYAKEDGKAITQIEGKPIDKDSEYSKMRLTLTDKDKNVKRVKFFYKDGRRFTMHILKHDDTFVTTDTTFGFDPKNYDGVHIEDLRF